MKILFLDDDHDRHKKIVRQLVGHSLDRVFSAQEAIACLEKNVYDLVMLDHDLGGPESENQLFDDAEDGRFVANWIAENSEKFSETSFIIHSLNEQGRKSMARTIKTAGLRVKIHPFAWSNLII